MKLKNLWFIFLLIISQTLYSQKESLVILKGTVINFNNQVQVADASDLAVFFLPNLERTFLPDSAGQFSISFKINKPNYFKIGRNILFLSPGDKMDVVIDREYAEKATFRGRGAKANTYLRNTTFPKGGSFLKAGKEIRNNYDNTVENILLIAKQREKELVSYKNISKEFRDLEMGRIKADIINSLWDIRHYYRDDLPEETANLFKEEYFKKINPVIKEYAEGFYQSEFLKLEVYRDILDIIDNYSVGITTNNIEKNKIRDWVYADKIAYKLKYFSNKDSINSLMPAIDKIENILYKTLLKNVYSERMSFGNGDTAINFIAYNELNEKVSLEKYKGSVIYIDIWATWCGPCYNEMPYYNKLKEKYKDNKNIVFISLSIDSDINGWKKDLIERNETGNNWVIDILKLSDYSVVSVPRTIIIDKDFKVFDMNGPSPSSKKTVDLIEGLLK